MNSEIHRNNRTLFRVKLTCGCLVTSRTYPMRASKLNCSSGLGHGYLLPWTECTESNGKTTVNNWKG